MCCPFSCPKARTENIQVLQNNENKIHFVGNENKIRFVGYINFSPQNTIDSLLRFFQRLELAESYAEICDGGFDLFGRLFQTYVNQHVSATLHHLHESAHHIEEMLHAVCFFSDLTRILSGRFIEYHDKKKKQIDYMRTLARLLLAGSHLGATLSFTVRLLSGTGGYFAFAQLTLSLSGYALLTISTLWRRFSQNKQHHFLSDLSIYSTGLAYDIIGALKEIKAVKPFVSVLKRVRSLSHVIHGLAKRDRLMPPDLIKINGEITIPEQLRYRT
jgi:hypothetical protein